MLKSEISLVLSYWCIFNELLQYLYMWEKSITRQWCQRAKILYPLGSIVLDGAFGESFRYEAVIWFMNCKLIYLIYLEIEQSFAFFQFCTVKSETVPRSPHFFAFCSICKGEHLGYSNYCNITFHNIIAWAASIITTLRCYSNSSITVHHWCAY